jgi:hypothetical protein
VLGKKDSERDKNTNIDGEEGVAKKKTKLFFSMVLGRIDP